MVTKPSVSFLNDESDARLITSVDGILTAMTGNAHYATPMPPLADVRTAWTAFVEAVANAAGGGVVLTATKNEKRAALVALVRQLASYVQLACNEDMAALLSSGFPIQKPTRQPVGVLPAPSDLKVTFGPRSGELRAVASPVSGGATYNWLVREVANPSTVVQTAQTTGARNTFTGLTPGVVYQVTVNVVGSAGPSNWSEPVPQMAV